MSITFEEKSHGATMLRLIASLSKNIPELYFHLISNDQRSCYELKCIHKETNSHFSIGIYIKHSKKRLSPWRYTFLRAHQQELAALFGRCDGVFVLLIAGDDGVACLTYDDLKLVLDENYDDSEWVSVTRKLNQNYRIAGKDGKFDRPLARNNFPSAITSHLSNLKVHQNSTVNKINKKFWSFSLFK